MKRTLFMFSVTYCLLATLTGCKQDALSPQNLDVISYQDSVRQLHDSLKFVLRNEIIENLKGEWIVDTLEIDFNNSYYQRQAGISADTTFLNFGEIVFTDWIINQTDNDSTDFKNQCTLAFKGQDFPMSFDYLFYIPLDYKVFSYTREQIETPQDWLGSNADFLKNIGILDNFQVQRISDDEFKLTGLNKGIKNLKLKRK